MYIVRVAPAPPLEPILPCSQNVPLAEHTTTCGQTRSGYSLWRRSEEGCAS